MADRRSFSPHSTSSHKGYSSNKGHSSSRQTHTRNEPSWVAQRSYGPAIPDDIDFADLDPAVRSQLRVLPKEVAEVVGRHLIAAGRLVDSDPEAALKHAKAARTKAPRFGIVREAVGEAAYYCGDWHTALMELRAALRVSGNQSFLPMIIDCERALGRTDKAWQLLDEAAQRQLDVSIRVELAVLAAGMHREAGNLTEALKQVAIPELRSLDTAPWLARLRYCYADLLAERNQLDQAATWFTLAAAADADDDTDAADRLLELQGIALYSEGNEADTDESHVAVVTAVASDLPS